MSYIDGGEIIIGEHNWQQFVQPQVVDGEHKARGLIPRNWNTHPRGCYPNIKAVDLPAIPQGEWSQRLKDSIAAQAQLSDVRNRGNDGASIPSRDQNGRGYCWQHSGVSCLLILRATMHLPYVSLSAYAPACIIKGYADEGGWGAEGVDFLSGGSAAKYGGKKGVPSEEFWPQRSVSRANDNAATWADAEKHMVTEEWADLAVGQYDRNLSFAQNATCWLSKTPTVVDFNWWSHSVCGIDLVEGSSQRHATRMASGKLAQLHEFDEVWGMNNPVTGGFGCRIWNSWGDSWSQNGTGILTGNQAIPDGSVAPRSTNPN